MLYGPAAITQPQFASISSIYRDSESISSVLVASPLCTILQDRAIEALEELRHHIFYNNDQASSASSVPMIYRTRYDIALYYMIINQADVKTTNFCSSVLASPTGASPRSMKDFNKMTTSHMQQHQKSKKNTSGAHGQFNNAMISTFFVCVGLTGAAYIHASNPWLFLLPGRLHETTNVLTRLGKSLQENSQEGKKWVRALLASLISDEDDLKTNEDVSQINLSNALSVSDETNLISEKDQVLSMNERNMVPFSNFSISLPSTERENHGRSLRKLSHQSLDLQFGFDPPESNVTGDNYSMSGITFNSPRKEQNRTEIVLPSPFKTPRIARWRENISKDRRRQVPHLSNGLSSESIVTPDRDMGSYSLTQMKSNQYEPSHQSSPNVSSISHASSDTSLNTPFNSKGSFSVRADDPSPTKPIQNDIDNISSKVNQMMIDPIALKASNELAHSSPPRPSKQIINVGLNEDLECSYKASKLSSISVEGIIQIQVKPPRDQAFPFIIHIKDNLHHIKTVVENKAYAALTNTSGVKNEYLTYNVTLPIREEFITVFKYKCSQELRPVPVRVQTRVRITGDICRVAIQISSNPSNKTDLTDLNIFMAIPPNVRGETVQTSPAGGVWNEKQRHVLWCVAMLGIGEKFQLQAQFDLISQEEEGTLGEERSIPLFPILVRCHGSSNQLSSIEISVDRGDLCPIPLLMRAARRCRIAHKEQSS